MSKPFNFMGVRMRLANRQEILDAVSGASNEKPLRIATPNGEFYLRARKDPTFKDALEWMDLCPVDGSGPYFMLKFWRLLKGGPAFEHYTGADLSAELFEKYADGSKPFYFLGGPAEMLAQATAAISAKYPGIKIVGSEDPGAVDPANLDAALLERIRNAKPDILLVGFGAPKQELWIRQVAETLNVPVMVGVGGTFGFYATKKRAPQIVRSLHLEWLNRMLTERGHWKRVWRAVVVFTFVSLGWMTTNLLQKTK